MIQRRADQMRWHFPFTHMVPNNCGRAMENHSLNDGGHLNQHGSVLGAVTYVQYWGRFTSRIGRQKWRDPFAYLRKCWSIDNIFRISTIGSSLTWNTSLRLRISHCVNSSIYWRMNGTINLRRLSSQDLHFSSMSNCHWRKSWHSRRPSWNRKVNKQWNSKIRSFSIHHPSEILTKRVHVNHAPLYNYWRWITSNMTLQSGWQ